MALFIFLGGFNTVFPFLNNSEEWGEGHRVNVGQKEEEVHFSFLEETQHVNSLERAVRENQLDENKMLETKAEMIGAGIFAKKDNHEKLTKILKKTRPKNTTTTTKTTLTTTKTTLTTTTTTNYTSRCGSDAPTDFIEAAHSICHGIWKLIDWRFKEHSKDFTCGNELRLQSFNLVNRDLVLDPSLCGPPQTISWGQVIRLGSVTFVRSGRSSYVKMVYYRC